MALFDYLCSPAAAGQMGGWQLIVCSCVCVCVCVSHSLGIAVLVQTSTSLDGVVKEVH